MPIINGTAMWASVIQPNTKFEHKWCIDVCNLDDSNIEKLKELGLGNKIKHDDDRGYWIPISQKVRSSKGKEFSPPDVVDAQKRPFTGTIGNGSLVNVMFNVREWEYAGKSGISADLRGVQVVDLKKYEGGNSDSFSVVGEEDPTEDDGFDSLDLDK